MFADQIKKVIRKGRRVVGAPDWRTRAFNNARQWSNGELAQVAHLFRGDVINVSAWEDSDKAKRKYRDYFINAERYWISNFGTNEGVLQGAENEIFLDLQAPLKQDQIQRYNVVFNHTVLEHVYEFRDAFANLCALSNDVVIIVVPWLQPLHANYGDFWRFSPQAVVKLFAENGFQTHRITWNSTPRSSVYVFAVASRLGGRWIEALGVPIDPDAPSFTELPADFAGKNAL